MIISWSETPLFTKIFGASCLLFCGLDPVAAALPYKVFIHQKGLFAHTGDTRKHVYMTQKKKKMLLVGSIYLFVGAAFNKLHY